MSTYTGIHSVTSYKTVCIFNEIINNPCVYDTRVHTYICVCVFAFSHSTFFVYSILHTRCTMHSFLFSLCIRFYLKDTISKNNLIGEKN